MEVGPLTPAGQQKLSVFTLTVNTYFTLMGGWSSIQRTIKKASKQAIKRSNKK